MEKIAVITSRAASLMNVCRDIAYTVKTMRKTPILLDYLPPAMQVSRMSDGCIVTMTFNPLVSKAWFLLCRDLYIRGYPALAYVTVEGIPQSMFISPWLKENVKYVANSRYTASRLRKAGIKVEGIVYHGVNIDEVESIRKELLLSKAITKKAVKEKVGDGVVFGVIASTHKRKGHSLFVDVIRRVRERRPEAKFYILSSEMAKAIYAGVDGVFVDPRFGNLTRTEVFTIISSFDFYVQPSLAEGFCLPVLEAMAFGKPCIHIAYDPLTEFSNESFNLMLDYSEVKYETFHEGIEYELHYYNVDDFANTIINAVEMITERKSEYEDRSFKAMERAKEFDVKKLYPQLLSNLEKLKGGA
ncbi:MAG: hypothetical protein DRJ60_00395 [Thermoprotei archaeon]|nr:MAG: hypothetical protein DRJ60_00395 [Thermoprotei archaeon]